MIQGLVVNLVCLDRIANHCNERMERMPGIVAHQIGKAVKQDRCTSNLKPPGILASERRDSDQRDSRAAAKQQRLSREAIDDAVGEYDCADARRDQ